MIRRLMLNIPFTRESVFTAERVAGRGWMVCRNGAFVAQCDTEAEALDQADDYNKEVMCQARKTAPAPIALATGDTLQRKAAQAAADLFG